VNDVGVFPSLREGTVVPEVTLVREAVADESQLALLGVLLDRVELVILGDLSQQEKVPSARSPGINPLRVSARHIDTTSANCQSYWRSPQCTHLLLGVGPSRNLDYHVQHGLLLVGVKRNVVEGRDENAILLNVDAVLEGVCGTDLAGRVDW
jgi:hypothetical protein